MTSRLELLGERVDRAASMVKLRGKQFYVSEVLAGEQVALEEVAEDIVSVTYYGFELGRISIADP